MKENVKDGACGLYVGGRLACRVLVEKETTFKMGR